jgi:hypothetical protein
MEKIYMIPVNDAYDSDCECPLCSLRDNAEKNYLDYYLGPSLMEPDTRKITNRTGFCPVHMGMLNNSEAGRLGLGLMLHTHLKNMDAEVTGRIADSVPERSSGFLKGKDYKAKLNAAADLIDERIARCPICENMNEAMGHYIDVIIWMFKHDDAFRSKLENKTCCLPHTAALLRAATSLSQSDACEFVKILLNNSKESFKVLEDDVEWFTLKFDYRNKDKPWGNSKNAIQRSMRFLSSDRRDFDEQRTKQ